MADQPSEIFRQFKQSRSLFPAKKSIPEICFQLVFEDKQPLLLIVDKKGVEQTPDYRHYSGHTRGLLKAINQVQGRYQHNISWKRSSKSINLSENGFLLYQLRKCGCFVDKALHPIFFSDEPGTLVLSIEGEKQLTCSLSLKSENGLIRDVRFINSQFALAAGYIVLLTPAGTDFNTLISFETLILPSELERYLSLFFSYCHQIEVQFRDYQVMSGLALKPRPSIIFEKITQDNSLYVRVVQSLSGTDPTFIEEYDITTVVSVNHPDRQIIVSEVHPVADLNVTTGITKILNELKKECTEEGDFYQDGSFFIVESPLSELFAQKALPRLAMEFEVFGSENLEPYQIRMAKPELNLSLDHGIDFLEGSADLVIEGESFSLFEALHQFRSHAYINLSDGTKAIIDHDYVQKLERIFQKQKDGVKISFFDLPLVDELLEERIENSNYEDARNVYKGFLNLDKETVNLPEINATLRPYQIEGYKWLNYLRKHSLGGCLADDMGLGKTLQAITLLSSIYPGEQQSSLVVIPKSLVFNWQNEIKRFAPRLNLAVYYGSDRNLDSACRADVVISTYGTVRNDIEALKDLDFYYLILDESQTIKNHESQISRAVSLLKAEHRLALSGTPIENNLSELYALFRFLNPAMFGSLARFTRQYLFPIQQNGDHKAATELKKKILPFVLRRLKKDVLDDLPDKIEKILYVELSPEQKKFYEQRRSFYYNTIRHQIESDGFQKSQFFILQAITALRQIASIPEVKSEGQVISPKRSLLLEAMEEAIANNHKILLFANFLGVLEYLATDLSERNIDFETLTGATRNREQCVKRFQSDPNCKVFLMTLKTGGQGLNLTAADTIYIFDPWWNLAAENQAIDRSHRIGQDKTVFSYKLIAKGTIEERILQLQQKKNAIFQNVFSDESISFKSLAEKDVDYLMG
jgi:superfamily II DNA or RNA helicase